MKKNKREFRLNSERSGNLMRQEDRKAAAKTDGLVG